MNKIDFRLGALSMYDVLLETNLCPFLVNIVQWSYAKVHVLFERLVLSESKEDYAELLLASVDLASG